MDRLDGQMRQLGRVGAADEHLEAAPEPSARRLSRDARQAPSPPSSRPRPRSSGDRRQSREPVARRLGQAYRAGHDRLEDELAEVLAHLRRDVGGESRAAVDHREQHAAEHEARVEPAADEVDRARQLGEPLERVVLGLHRDEHAVGRRERVHGQRPERGRAVEEDEGVGAPRLLERVRRGSARRSRGARAPPRRRRAPACSGRGRGSRTSCAWRARAPARRRGGRTRTIPFARIPRPDVAFACGSRSMTSARSPASARHAARLIAVVVFPTPPFWFASA